MNAPNETPPDVVMPRCSDLESLAGQRAFVTGMTLLVDGGVDFHLRFAEGG